MLPPCFLPSFILFTFSLFLLPTFISLLPALSFLPSFFLSVSPSPSCTCVRGKLVRFQFPALHPWFNLHNRIQLQLDRPAQTDGHTVGKRSRWLPVTSRIRIRQLTNPALCHRPYWFGTCFRGFTQILRQTLLPRCSRGDAEHDVAKTVPRTEFTNLSK